jgi:hypothetical protein
MLLALNQDIAADPATARGPGAEGLVGARGQRLPAHGVKSRLMDTGPRPVPPSGPDSPTTMGRQTMPEVVFETLIDNETPVPPAAVYVSSDVP